MKKIFVFIFLGLLSCGLTWAQRLPEFEKAREIKLLEMNRDDVRKVNLFPKDINKTIYETKPANVRSLILSFPEMIANCDSVNDACSSGIKTIAVFAVAEIPGDGILTFSFKVSGGSIIDKGKTEGYGISKKRFQYEGRVFQDIVSRYGKKIVWDLSDVKPGTYTITAAVDDGCGFCGTPMTKTVIVKECPDCLKN